MLRADNVSAAYGSDLALDGLSFEIAANQLTAVVGPSGCGTTTLLPVAGFEPVTGGSLSIDGREVARADDKRAFA